MSKCVVCSEKNMSTVIITGMILLFSFTFGRKACTYNSSSDSMNCSHLKLVEFPQNVPFKTKQLLVSHNKINRIKATELLPNLVYLDMSHNKISSLENTTFRWMCHIRELYLDHNKLLLNDDVYPAGVFLNLPLEVLHLHKNDLSGSGTYPRSLGELTHVKELRIDTFHTTVFGPEFSMMVNLSKLLLGFDGCNLNALKNETFQMMSNLTIGTLNLNQCPLEYIEAASFQWLKSLKCLLMSHTNFLEPEMAFNSMYGLQSQNLDIIKLNSLHSFNIYTTTNLTKYILSKNTLSYLKDVCVTSFVVRRNLILWVEYIELENTRFAKCIRHLDLSENVLYGSLKYMFYTSYMPNLVYVNISRHLASGNIFPLKKVQETLNQLDLNNGYKTRMIGFTLPDTLEKLDVNGFSVYQLKMDYDIRFFNASSLRQFNIAFNLITAFKMKFHGLGCLRRLDVTGNMCGNMSTSFFSEMRSLRVLDMSHTSLNVPDDYMSENGLQLLKPLSNLENISLNHNQLTHINPKMFEENPLKEIFLANNRFTNVPFDLTTTPDLVNLDLSTNMLIVLTKTEMEMLDRHSMKKNLTVNLSGNILTCNCDNLNFIIWLFDTYVYFQGLYEYSCIREDASHSKIVDTFYELPKVWRKCNGRMWLSLSMTLFLLLFLCLAFAYIVCWRKTLILNALLRLFGFSSLITRLERQDFRYDVFLGASEQDNGGVPLSLSENLEVKQKLEVFVPERDVLPGRSIPQEIIRAVDSSWRLVLILNQAFLEDNWCRFIADYAVYVSTFRPGCVILVLFDDVRIGDICPSLLNVVDEEQIFNVKDHPKDVLWRSISKSVKTEKE